MKKYSIIYADPPWRYKVYSKKGLGRSAESHYPTMELEDIRALPVGTLAADDCVLFLWQDGSFEPSAGQIIFFDWDNKGSSGPQDGQSDHVGIVEKCENGIVYTIEGNSGDSCRQNQYPVGYYEILGYGIPAF